MLERQAESRGLDYKAPMSFGPGNREKAKIIKCLMAFANTQDGGSILVGVSEASGKFVSSGLTDRQADSFDQSKVGRLCS